MSPVTVVTQWSKNNRWSYAIFEPGEAIYTSPYKFHSEKAARAAGEADIAQSTPSPQQGEQS